MGSPNLPHMHATYLFTSISHSPYHPSVPPVPSSSLPPPSDDTHCQVCQSPFDEHQMLLCELCNAGWHMDCLLPPLTTIPHGLWKCPLCLPRHLLPQSATLHLRLPRLPPSSISTLINMLPNKMTTCLYAALPDSPLPQNTTKKTPCVSMHLGADLPTQEERRAHKAEVHYWGGPGPLPKSFLSLHKPNKTQPKPFLSFHKPRRTPS